MNTPSLRVLIVEDSEPDAELLLRELEKAGFDPDWRRVFTREDYLRELDRDVDIILSDFSMPQFDGLQAFQLLKERHLDIPFILVSGTIGEDRAVAAIKAGVTDYVLKDRRSRLGEAVQRALREQQTRRERDAAEAARRQSEHRFRLLFDSVPMPVWAFDLHTDRILEVNPSAIEKYGYSREDFLTMPFSSLEQGASLGLEFNLKPASGPVQRRHRLSNGHMIDVELTAHQFDFEGRPAILVLSNDITARLTSEEAERDQRRFAESLASTAALLNSILKLDQLLDRLLENIHGVLPYDLGAVLLIDGDSARVLGHRGYAERGLDTWVESLRFPLAETPTLRRMIETRQPLLLSDVSAASEWVSMAEDQDTRSFVGAPIITGQQITGFITLHSIVQGHFHRVHAERMQSFALHAAIAIDNACLVEQLESANLSLESRVRARTEELLAAKNHTDAILAATGEAIIVLDERGHILSANPAFEHLTAIQLAKVEGRHFSEAFYSFGRIGELRHILDNVKHGKVWRGEARVRRHNSERFDAALTFTPYQAGSLTGSVCAMRDVTPLKEVARLKEEFVANVSHELRTPITGLQLNLELMDRDPDRWRHYHDRMSRWMKRLINLIEDLLRLSRLEQGAVSLESRPFDLASLVQANIMDREPMAEIAGLTLDFLGPAEGIEITGDEGLLGQVLSILLTNAFNYTPRGGRVTVSVFRASRDHSDLVAGFSIQDSGPGIAPEEQPHIFERFYRGEVGRTSGKAGTGLGLSIAQRIIEEHGGRIELESEGVDGKGALFTVWLKAAP